MGDYVIEPLRGIEYVYSNNTKLIHEILNNRIPLDRKYHEVPVFEDRVVKIALCRSLMLILQPIPCSFVIVFAHIIPLKCLFVKFYCKYTL